MPIRLLEMVARRSPDAEESSYKKGRQPTRLAGPEHGPRSHARHISRYGQ